MFRFQMEGSVINRNGFWEAVLRVETKEGIWRYEKSGYPDIETAENALETLIMDTRGHRYDRFKQRKPHEPAST